VVVGAVSTAVAVVGAGFTVVVGAAASMAVAGLAAVAAGAIAGKVPMEVRDLSTGEVLIAAEVFAAGHPTVPAEVPTADSDHAA
jgi:hypothetical protein